ncbi:MAG: type II toxin-antitoxin system VapC family toxin [Candidatus Sumerlaeota bacterium]|nr:type II toxin-antitoxin system VapC family toxin [Candidatus Sumerlaeota bacterium]
MRQKIYIETSVVSYLVARLSSNAIVAGHQAATHKFWQRLDGFDVYVSDLVLQEAGRGDAVRTKERIEALASFVVLDTGDEEKALARDLVYNKAVPEGNPEDALHIATAAMNGMGFIVTWNFSHINNPFTKMLIRQVVENAGFVCPEICSPDELLGEPI